MMKRPGFGFYAFLGIALVIPMGVRAYSWLKPTDLPINPDMASAGKALFLHEFKPRDSLCNGGDGLGPVFNASSCVACHHQGAVGGGGDLKNNVTMFTLADTTPTAGLRGGFVSRANTQNQRKEGVVHSKAIGEPETLADVDSSLPPTSQPTLEQLIVLRGRSSSHCIQFPIGVHVSQRNTPALFGAKLIDELPERVIIAQERAEQLKAGMTPSTDEQVPVGRALRLADGRIGRFGWKGQTASLSDFVRAACANELGLGNPGQAQPTPLNKPDYRAPGLDLTLEQCDQITSFVTSLSRPVEKLPDDVVAKEHALAGKKLFNTIGCADCHTPSLGGIDGLYSDLLLHRMGEDLVGGGSYIDLPPDIPDFKPGEGPSPGEWRTPPLWGVANSAPYLHDGRAATLEEAIQMHGGQGARSARKFAALAPAKQFEVVTFLKTLKAP